MCVQGRGQSQPRYSHFKAESDEAEAKLNKRKQITQLSYGIWLPSLTTPSYSASQLVSGYNIGGAGQAENIWGGNNMMNKIHNSNETYT